MLRKVMESGGNPNSVSPDSVGDKGWGVALESTPNHVGAETSTEMVLSSLRTCLLN